MKKTAILAGVLALAAGVSHGQVIIDGFEDGVSGFTTAGFPVLAQKTDGGADATTASLRFTDAGFSVGFSKDYAPGTLPSSGGYKLQFSYQNGVNGNEPMPALTVTLNSDFSTDLVIPDSQVLTWTQLETGTTFLDAGTTISINFSGNQSVTENREMWLDQFTLVPDAIPINITEEPPSRFWISGTTSVTLALSGGSGTYTQADFDVMGDSTVDFSDTTPGDGFNFDFDTTALPDGETSVVITVTDDSTFMDSETVTYFIFNAGSGVSTVFENGLETFTGVVPDGWVEFNVSGTGVAGSPAYTASQETTSVFEGTSALRIDYAANPDPTRYQYRSNAFNGAMDNYVLSFAGRGGSFVRMYYFRTIDGTSWEQVGPGVFSDSTTGAYKFVVGDAYDPSTTDPVIGGQQLAVATHFFGTGTGYWDDVTVTATDRITPASASNWDLYSE